MLALPFTTDHLSSTGNAYAINDVVYYLGNVYRCIASNDSILPTNTLYWTNLGAGFPLVQQPSDWNATTGNNQILNKPTIPAAQVNSDWNAVSGVAEILNKPTIPVNLDDLADVNAPTPTNGQVLTYNNTTSDWEAATPSGGGSGTVTSVGTTGLISGGPITTSGTITTSMNTDKLVGRYSAGTGIMEEITVGSGLTLTGAGVLNNTATPTPTGYYGAFQDNTTQTAVSANTAYAVKLNTTDLTNGVSVVNDGSGNPTQITLANTGIYNIQFSLQLEKTGGSGNFIVDIWIRKNGVDVPNTTGKVVLTGSANASPVVGAWNYVLDLAANDYVQLMWSTSNNNAIILSAAATPPHPGIPSAILTVTQQAGIMAGTGITAINSLTGAAQSLVVGTGGTDFAVSSLGTTHTFNLPTASAANRGALSSADWSTFNGKQNSIGLTTVGTNLATLPNPSAVRYLRINADNTVSALTLAQLKTDLSVGSDISVVLPADVLTVGTGFEDVTGLSFAVTAGKTYKWRATIRFAMVSGTAIFSTNGPAVTITNSRFTITTGLTANAVSNQTTYDAGANVVVSSAGLATADGIVRVSASGTWTIRFRSSIGGNFRAGSGSVLEYSEVL